MLMLPTDPRTKSWLRGDVVGVDWSNPLTHKLKFLFVFWGFGNAAAVKGGGGELVTGRSNDDNNGGTLVRTIYGNSLTFGTSTPGPKLWPTGYKAILTSDGVGTGDFTIACVANPPSQASSAFLFGQAPSSGGSGCWLIGNRNGVTNTDSAGVLGFQCTDGTNFSGTTQSSAIDGTYRSMMAVRNGTTHNLYNKGVLTATTVGTVRNLHNSANLILQLGGFSGFSVGANCAIPIAAAWDRALSAGEALQFNAAPYQLLRTIDDDLMALLSPATLAAAGNPFTAVSVITG